LVQQKGSVKIICRPHPGVFRLIGGDISIQQFFMSVG
jgi:hypothetical protein